jgi:hypothetical protein
LAPQLPSVVTIPLGTAGVLSAVVVGLPSTGSPDVVVEGGRLMAGAGSAALEAVGAASLHPFWQPLATKQWPSVLPQ